MIAFRAMDMMFGTKIRAAAEAAGVAAREVRTVDRLVQLLDGGGDEPVTGVFVDLEVGDEATELIRAAAAHAARPTIVAFGSHVATAQLEAARDAGADHVLPRSAFAVRLTDLIEQYGRSAV